MTKKQISILLLLIMCLAFTLTFTACWDKFPPINNSDDDNTNDNDNSANLTDEDNTFNDYGMNVITVVLKDVNVNENGIYDTKEEVGAYIHLYNKLPSNYTKNKNEATKNHTAANKISYGGVQFYNRESLLPYAQGRTYTECDIGYQGGSRNSLRIVFSSDGLVFYTADHYASFSILRFV